MKFIASIFFILLLKINVTGQNRFNSCSAIFLNKKIVVDDYSPTGKCIISATTEGVMTVNAATNDNGLWLLKERVPFKIIIKDGQTKTLLSFSDVTYEEIDVKKILSKCQKGDSILVSITNDAYALPHNEIYIQ